MQTYCRDSGRLAELRLTMLTAHRATLDKICDLFWKALSFHFKE